MNYDKILVDLFWDKITNTSTKLYRRFNQKTNHYINIYEYLLNRFNDSESSYESLIRLVYNIYNRPTCKTCGGYIKFIGKPKTKGIYCNYCCGSCRQKDFNVYNKQKESKLKKYGTVNNIQKTLTTKLERYGDSTYNNRDKAKITNLKIYGFITPRKNELVKEKSKQTCLKRYGVEYTGQIKEKIEKTKQTNNIRYGGNSPMSSKEIADKVNITKRKNLKHNGSSKEEKYIFSLIQKKFPNAILHYTSELYPFICDFYIPEFDLYIEYNGFPTHGPHPYDKNSKEDKELLNQLKKRFKNKNIAFGKGDILKRYIANKNKLNFKELWDVNEAIEYINTLK